MAYIEINETPGGFLYPRIKGSRTVTSEEMIKELAQESTLTASDVKAVLAGLSGILVKHLKEGNRVRFDDLGEFYATLSVEASAKGLQKEEIQSSDLKFKQLHFLADQRLNRSFSDFRLARRKGYSKGEHKPGFARRQELMAGLFTTCRYVTVPAYCRHTGVSVHQARKDMARYVDKGIVRLERTGTGHYYYPTGGGTGEG